MTNLRVDSGLYTIKQAAERLGIGLAQAYRLDNAGRFPVPVVYVGAVRKVRVAELETFLQGSAVADAGQKVEHTAPVSDSLRRLDELCERLRAERPARRPVLTVVGD